MQNEVEMDPEKLNFLNPNLQVWDCAKISTSEFQNLRFEDKSSILKTYHVDTSSKYPDGKGEIIFCLFPG